MRIVTSTVTLWHSWRALRLTKAAGRCLILANIHAEAADQLLARSSRSVPRDRTSPAGAILLASIVGMAICATWIAFAWRAAG